MSIKRIYAIMLRTFFLTRRNPTRLVPFFLWSILTIVLWGFISKYLALFGGAGVTLASVFLSAILLWEFLNRVMHSFVTAFFEDVWSRNFFNLFASPLKISEYITGLVLTTIILSSLALLVMVVIVSAIFHLSLAVYGVFLFPLLLTLYLTGIALGIFGAALVVRFGPPAEWLIWPIPSMLAPFVGVFYPISVLPHWMQNVALILPPTYVFEGMRAILAGHSISPNLIYIALFGSVLYILLAYGFFVLVYRRAVKSGLLARYSAESI